MKGLKALCCGLLMLGVIGCSTTTTPRRADVPVRDGVMHKVLPGETVEQIAKTYDVSPELIARVNNVKDPRHVAPGSRLFIPSATEIKNVEIAGGSYDVLRKDGLYHTVRPGETLTAIAGAYGLPMREIQQANNINDASYIRTGDRIWIPRAREVADVPIPKAIITTNKPMPEFKDEPRVDVNVVRTPTPKPPVVTPPQRGPLAKASTIEPAPTRVVKQEPVVPKEPQKGPGREVEFPREVKEFGPERFQWPLKDIQFRVLRGYSRGEILNPGIDLGAPVGTPIYAAADGSVSVSNSVTDPLGDSLGNYVILFHGERNGKAIYTIYAHNSQNMVKPGETVKRGQQIARIGNTGRPYTSDTGVLHFEVRESAESLNPLDVLPPLN